MKFAPEPHFSPIRLKPQKEDGFYKGLVWDNTA